jgi:hypothetical protein
LPQATAHQSVAQTAVGLALAAVNWLVPEKVPSSASATVCSYVTGEVLVTETVNLSVSEKVTSLASAKLCSCLSAEVMVTVPANWPVSSAESLRVLQMVYWHGFRSL